MHRLVLLCASIVFFDVAWFAAITPLLPHYATELQLTATEAGLLSGSYAVGTLCSSLPSGYVAARWGPRRTVIAGLMLLGASTLVFGFAEQFELLFAARLVQGVSGALTWAGAITWLVLTGPDGRRGSSIGTVVGSGVSGALVGPLLGALADGIGTRPVFASLSVIAAALAWLALRFPEAAVGEPQSVRAVARLMARPAILVSAGLVIAPALLFAIESVIVPLRVDDLGGGGLLIAIGFSSGAVLEAVLAPLAGRYSDRVGRLSLYRPGMAICAIGILVVGLASAPAVIIAAVPVISVGIGVSLTPAGAALSDAAERAGLHQGLAAGAMNLAWASGQVVGTIGSGAAVSVWGFATPTVAAAVALVALTIGIGMPRRRGVRSSPAPSRGLCPSRPANSCADDEGGDGRNL